MSEKEHDMTNDGGESVTYTLRNIPADTDRVITDLASHARKPKATFLREFLEDSFRDVIDSFALKNPLIASLDEELASYLDAKVMEQRYQSHFITRWNQEYQKLLGISTEEELRRLVLNNTPFLQVRADQVLKGWKNIPRGISLTFSLFAEIAGQGQGNHRPGLEKYLLLATEGKKTPLLPRYRGHPRPEKTACPHRRQLDAGWHHGAYLPPGKLRPRRMARYTEPPGKLRHPDVEHPVPGA
uniref:hypothetical protein n=1 Tax=Escherichia coli TaxID=562 RepID=UPI003D815C61